MKKFMPNTRCAAVLLMAAGYGWAGGHYIPANSPLIAYAFQFSVLSLLLILGTTFLGLAENQKQKGHWSIKGLTIFSFLSLLINILNVIHGAFRSRISSYGSHNTFADLVPIALIIMGTGLWLCTLTGEKNIRRHAE